jgi:hypothetical protein
VDDITLESFEQQPTTDTFTLTVAQIFNVSIASITILNITRVSKEGLQFKKYMRPAVLVQYEVILTLMTRSLDFSAQQLITAVSSGSFTARMHENALKHNVTALLTAATSSVSIISGLSLTLISLFLLYASFYLLTYLRSYFLSFFLSSFLSY